VPPPGATAGPAAGVHPLLYLQPFLDVVRSDETGVPIKGATMHKIQSLNFWMPG